MARSASASKFKLNLNLLFPQGVAQKLPIKFLRWLITYGRLLAIIVEVIVLATFALRFKLDANLADLKQKINLQVPYIESLGADEALIKQTQLKLSTVKSTYSQNSIWHTTLSKIAAQEPQGVTLASINVSMTDPSAQGITFKLSGTASTITDLAIFLGGLKTEQSFKKITLTTISFDSGSLTFTISGAGT